VQRTIIDLADDIRSQLLHKIHSSSYIAVKLDESTDIAGCVQLIAFVRFQRDERITEEIPFCKALPANTTGECLYSLFVESTCDFNINWTKCIRLCTDDAKAMTGKKSGFVTRLKNLMPNAEWIHCFSVWVAHPGDLTA